MSKASKDERKLGQAAKAPIPSYLSGPALTEWLREQRNARTKLAEHGLDLDGKLTDEARAEGYKEPK